MRRSDKKRALRAAAAATATCRLPTTRRADAGDAGAPKWQQIFPFGTFHNGGWPTEGITIDAEYCATMIANWKKRGSPALPIDYLHRGGDDEDVVDLPAAEKAASGWMEDFEVRKDGMWALTKWTPRARDLITADEYRFLSPEWMRNGIDGHTGKPQGPTLIGAGLLNRPAFKEMPRVAAAEVVDPPAPNPAVPELIMNRAQIDAMLKEAGISLAATATDAEATAALQKHISATSKASAEVADALKAKSTAAANEEALRAQLTAKNDETSALKASLAEVTKSVAKMESDRFAAGLDALQKRLVAEGRITAAAQANVKTFAEKQGLEEAVKFYDTFPKSGAVPLGKEVGHGNAGEMGTALTQAEAHVKYMAAVDELQAKGMKAAEAFSRVNREQPALANAASKSLRS